MNFLTTTYTDKGIKKDTNQDSVLLKVVKATDGGICLAAVCDGMGGLAKGELASATVIRAFNAWFENEMPKRICDLDFATIKSQWITLIEEQNRRISDYGKRSGISLGTTLSVILLVAGQYIFAHVGDSRIYQFRDSIEVLTNDQTVVARDIERGVITPEEAASDPRRNVLLQCIGASRVVTPQVSEGDFDRGEMFMLCSDGFRHEISSEEIFDELNPSLLQNEKIMLQKSVQLVELCKMRHETDNITVALIKTV